MSATEIGYPPVDNGPLQVLHSNMLEPEPLPEPEGRAMSTPTVADLEAATAATEAAINDPAADLAAVYLAAEAEEAAYAQVFTGPCDRAPEPEIEI